MSTPHIMHIVYTQTWYTLPGECAISILAPRYDTPPTYGTRQVAIGTVSRTLAAADLKPYKQTLYLRLNNMVRPFGPFAPYPVNCPRPMPMNSGHLVTSSSLHYPSGNSMSIFFAVTDLILSACGGKSPTLPACWYPLIMVSSCTVLQVRLRACSPPCTLLALPPADLGLHPPLRLAHPHPAWYSVDCSYRMMCAPACPTPTPRTRVREPYSQMGGYTGGSKMIPFCIDRALSLFGGP